MFVSPIGTPLTRIVANVSTSSRRRITDGDERNASSTWNSLERVQSQRLAHMTLVSLLPQNGSGITSAARSAEWTSPGTIAGHATGAPAASAPVNLHSPDKSRATSPAAAKPAESAANRNISN